MSAEPSGIDYSAVLADLKARRAQIDAAIAGIEAALLGQATFQSSTENKLLPGASGISGDGVVIQRDMFFSLSIPAATKKYLALLKRVASTKEIYGALRSGGQVNASNENFKGTLSSVLDRVDEVNGGIVRVSRGMWGLAEWYPNKPRKGTNPE